MTKFFSAALGCPEPIIQEVFQKHHDFGGSGILPYHGLSSSDSYPGFSGPPPDAFGGSFGGVFGPGAGSDFSGVYSNSPAPVNPVYSGPSYLPPGDSSYSSAAPSGPPSSDPSSGYPGYTNRRRVASTGRQISEESTAIFGDLIFRFLGVNTDQCRRRFVCELEFRNPFMKFAAKYIG